MCFLFRASPTQLQFEFAVDSSKSFRSVCNFNVTPLNWKTAPQVNAVRELVPTLVMGCWLIGVDGRRVLVNSSCFYAYQSLKQQGPFHPDAVENAMVLLLHIPDASWFKLPSFDLFERCRGEFEKFFCLG